MGRTRTRKQLEKLAWDKTPRDYRSMFEGKRHVLASGPRGSTLKQLDRMSDDELLRLVR